VAFRGCHRTLGILAGMDQPPAAAREASDLPGIRGPLLHAAKIISRSSQRSSADQERNAATDSCGSQSVSSDEGRRRAAKVSGLGGSTRPESGDWLPGTESCVRCGTPCGSAFRNELRQASSRNGGCGCASSARSCWPRQPAWEPAEFRGRAARRYVRSGGRPFFARSRRWRGRTTSDVGSLGPRTWQSRRRKCACGSATAAVDRRYHALGLSRSCRTRCRGQRGSSAAIDCSFRTRRCSQRSRPRCRSSAARPARFGRSRRWRPRHDCRRNGRTGGASSAFNAKPRRRMGRTGIVVLLR